MSQLSGAQAVVECLKREGVEYVFGVAGTCILPILEILVHTPEIKYIGTTHEQIAVHMAEGYARASGKIGVVIVSRAPGSANTIIGMVNAYPACAPVLVIAGQTSTYHLGREAFEEFDLVSIFRPITKYSYQVERTEKIPELLRRAFKVSLFGRPGPVFLAIPQDLLREERDFNFFSPGSYHPPSGLMPDPTQIEKAANLLIESQNAALFVGRGIIISKAVPELIELAELLSLPVVPTFAQCDIFPTDHPLYHWDKETINQADTLLVIGTRLSEFSTDAWTLIAEETKIIQVDIDSFQLAKVYPIEVGILSDAKMALRELICAVKKRLSGSKKEMIQQRFVEIQKTKGRSLKARWPTGEWDEKPIRPWRLIRDIREVLDKKVLIVEDSASLGSWIRRCFDFYEPETFYTGIGGAMGFGFPSALGVKLAKKDRQVVCITGDGSLMMVISALSTMVNYSIPIVLVINNNQSYMQIKFRQKPPYLGSILRNPPFEKIAELFGAYGERVEDPKDIKPALQRALQANGPAVLNVITIEDPKYATPHAYFGTKPRYLSGEISKK
jgi:acetolactate synthase-1/2/3 large subunit